MYPITAGNTNLRARIRIGLDRLRDNGFTELKGRSVGLLCNHASIGADLTHAIDALLPLHLNGHLNLAAVFGPQHGLWGHTQDNMIEWRGGTDARTGLTVHSLYGEHREPTDEMLDGVDTFVIDIPDVGARCYTFIWTAALCLKACSRKGIPVVVLDRPNPIGGAAAEGPVLDPAFASFIGLHPLPLRHGLTVGEVCLHIRNTCYPHLELGVVRMEGWSRKMRYRDTGLPWVAPSPNLPTPETATVYPGMALFEGAVYSEGRGTTTPFETFGQPGLDGWKLAERFNAIGLPGVRLRPVVFEPTFDKYRQELCGGCFVHVTDTQAFRPVWTAVTILQCLAASNRDAFAWREGPFEYENNIPPIDILAGCSWIREGIDDLSTEEVRERLDAEAAAFEPLRREAILYTD